MPTPTATIFLPYHALDDVILRGPRAAQPAASAVVAGTLYAVTDEGTLVERSTGSAWEAYSPAAVGGGGAPNPHALTHTAGGSDPLPYVDLPEGLPADPPPDTARVYALDVNGYTQVEMRDGAAKVVRFSSDNVLIAKVTEPAGIPRGQCVYLAGATGANPEVRLARADDINTMPTIGLALDAGAQNGFIRVLLSGTLALLNTSAFAEGAPLFVSPTTAGALTTTLPIAPDYAQRVGFVTRSHATSGEILVLPTGVLAPPRLHATTHEPGGTDALVNAAWTNVTNVFTADQRLEKGIPALTLLDTSQPADGRNFRLMNSSQAFRIAALNDAGTIEVVQAFAVDRVGNAYIAQGLFEKSRTTPMGHWLVGDLANYSQTGQLTGPIAYAVVGKTLLLVINGSGTSTAVAFQRVNIPGGFTVATSFSMPISVNAAGVWRTGLADFPVGTYVDLYDQGLATWPAGSVIIRGSFAIPIA